MEPIIKGLTPAAIITAIAAVANLLKAFGIADMHGLWFVQGDFVRDVAALNKMELLPWDVWGLMRGPDEDNTAEDLAFLDDLAALTAGDVPDFDKVRSLYEADARLHVPDVIQSFVAGVPRPVSLAAAMAMETRP